MSRRNKKHRITTIQAHPSVVDTPTGEEIVTFEQMSEETGSYSLGELELLLRASDPHRHLTPIHVPRVSA